MSNHYFLHSVSSVHSANQDRDLSRAAAERYLILEALAERVPPNRPEGSIHS